MFTTKKILILIGKNAKISLIVILLTILSIFFIKKETIKLTDEIKIEQKSKLELSKRTELYSIIENDAKIIGQNDKIIENTFIPSNNITEFLTEFDKIGSKYGAIQNYHFETPTVSSISKTFNISTISYSNSLNMKSIINLISYLKDFEKLPYFTKIDSITILSQDKLGWDGLSSITVKATLETKTTN